MNTINTGNTRALRGGEGLTCQGEGLTCQGEGLTCQATLSLSGPEDSLTARRAREGLKLPRRKLTHQLHGLILP